MNYYEGCKVEEILQYWKKILPEKKTDEEIVDYLQKTIGLQMNHNEVRFKPDSLWDRACKEAEQIQSDLENSQNDTVAALNLENFYKWTQPIVEENIKVFSEQIENVDQIADKQKIIEDTYTNLEKEMLGISLRTLVFETNYRTSQGIALEGRIVDFYKDYSVLYQMMKKEAKQYVNYLVDIIAATCSNKSRIEENLYSGEDIGKLVNIEVELGDKHCNGKTVAIIHFEKKKVVYKPRSLCIDQAFQKLITWMNENMQLPHKLRTMNIYEGETCGWCEYIENRECEDEKLKEFYEKLGMYVCIMYVLNTTDMHYENVIADGADPMFIDLESLLNVSMKEKATGKERGTEVLTDFFGTSVHQIGLLPHKIKLKSGEIEVGGIGNKKQQEAPVRSLKMVQGKENSLKLEYFNSKIDGKKNAPKGEEKDIDIEQYVFDIVNGFEMMYIEILGHKEALRKKMDSLFTNARIRVIVKPTLMYANLLHIMLHPDFLQVPVTKAVLLSRIGLYKINVKDDTSIVQSEISQLAESQIPYFYSCFQKKELYDGCTEKPVCEVVNTAKEMLDMKLNTLSLEDCKRQICLITSTFYKRNTELNRVLIDENMNRDTVSSKEVLETCEEIAEYIMLRSCTGTSENGLKERFFWASSVMLIEDDNWTCTLNDMDIYDGNAGIVYMLYLLWKNTGKEKYRQYIDDCVVPIEEMIQKDVEGINKTGFCKGLGGFLFMYTILLQDASFAEKRDVQLKLIEYAKTACELDTETDFIGGNAGLLASLLYTYKAEKEQQTKIKILEAAHRAAHHLMEHYKPTLSGFAHGFNGLLPFIYGLHTIEPKEEYLQYVKELLKTERSKFWLDKERDWSSSFDGIDYAYGWCHGSPGILLGKVLLYKMGYRDEKIESEIETAVYNLIHKGIGNNMCLCHGDLGNLWILRYYAEVMGDKEKLTYSERRYQDIYQGIIKNSWNAYPYTINKFNGLMIGLSGEVVSLLHNLFH